MNRYIFRIFMALVAVWLPLSAFSAGDAPMFITGIVKMGDGNFAVAEKGRKQVAIYTPDFKTVVKTIPTTQSPTGVAEKDGKLYVTQFDTEGSLLVVDAASGKIEKSVATGSGATAPIVSLDGGKVFVNNQFQGTVSEFDIAKGEVVRQVSVLREPKAAVEVPGKDLLLVANFLPQQRADIDTVAACVSVIDLKKFEKVKDIRLANGSNALNGIGVSGDGQYALVTHNLGRFQVPTSQLQQGWMNTSAVSVINLSTMEFEGAVLVDEPERGAAGTWFVGFTPDQIVVSHSGTHEISVIDYDAFVEKFKNTQNKEALSYDLNFLYGMRDRIKLYGNGPREFIIADNTAYIPTYFSDTVNIVRLGESPQVDFVALNPNRTESQINKGERYFNDASYCFQNWQSCNGCHPGDARMDAMNWDLMNDGIGNSKSCKSMLFAHVTAPSMISGIRKNAELAVRAGFKLIQFIDVPEDIAVAVDEYLKSLRPLPSPYLVNGELSEKAKKGRKVFESLGCDKCHSGTYYTDMQLHRIGEDVEFEQGWDTPTLIEVWRTAPYLFDGRAATMREVFEVHKHGIDRKVSKAEMDQLVEYVNSL